jgi:hypothetical protein
MADDNLSLGTHGTYMLSTYDNPFSPFTQFTQWYAYDVGMGYHSASFLARIVASSDDLSPASQALALEQAIDEIVSENVSGMWRKVKEEDFDVDSDDKD